MLAFRVKKSNTSAVECRDYRSVIGEYLKLAACTRHDNTSTVPTNSTFSGETILKLKLIVYKYLVCKQIIP